MVRATDTHVLVFVITTARVLEECEIWLAFAKLSGTLQLIQVQLSLLTIWCKGLLFMYILSGCGDTVPSFCGIGKKTVWDV